MAIVSGNKSKCPDCGADAFGVLQLADSWKGTAGATLACESCGISYYCSLPKLQKRILYVDQCALGHMLKPFGEWSRLHARLAEMVESQRIVCPSSWHHREEAEFSKDKFDQLMNMARTLGRNNHLLSHWEIHIKQLNLALECFLQGNQVAWDLPARDAFHDDPNAWHPLLTVHVLRPRDEESVASRRETKRAVHQIMETLYADPAYTSRSFEEQVKRETDGFAGAIIDTHNRVCREIMDARAGLPVSDSFGLPPPPAAKWVQWALAQIHKAAPECKATDGMADFFYSPQFACVPFVRINAVLRAAIATKARDSGRKAKPSDMYDLEILAAYMPYCDAMLLDGEMQSLARDGKAQLDQAYQTRLFSARDLPSVFEWLDAVESSLPDELKAAVSDLYGGRFDRLPLRKGRNLHEPNAWEF